MVGNRPLTTAEIPAQFLQTTFLVGHVPQRALASDQRVSYSLYIPPKQYNPNPDGPLNNGLKRLPLLVHVHGTGRNLSAMRDDLVTFAESTPCAVVAPLFPTCLDGPNDLNSYKLLRSPSLRSDLAILSMLDEIAYQWPGIDTEKVFMMGFSGGGQFAHRFLYLYPERLSAVSIGAPGRVTLLDESQNWPVGVSNVDSLFGRTIKKDLIRKVNVQLVVGRDDVEIQGGKEFWIWLRQISGQLQDKETSDLPVMKHGRLKTLQDLQEAFKMDKIDATLDIVDEVRHDADGVRDCVLHFLRPFISRSR
ncbi:Fc.00g116380.m01.CDS01 [Cosmosporella sp. VM-42]